MIRGTHLSLSLGGAQILKDVSVDVAAGEVAAVVGPSGSGKSTLMHCLAGLLTPQEGQVWCGDEEIGRLSDTARSKVRLSRMGFVFQFGDLIPELTLAENVEMPSILLGSRPAAARETARAWLDRFGIADLADRRVSAVSGGEAQRAAVARALAHRPAVVFADEPTGSLDTASGHVVLGHLLSAARDTGTTVLLVTHDAQVAAAADRIVEMRDGRLSETRQAESV